MIYALLASGVAAAILGLLWRLALSQRDKARGETDAAVLRAVHAEAEVEHLGMRLKDQSSRTEMLITQLKADIKAKTKELYEAARHNPDLAGDILAGVLSPSATSDSGPPAVPAGTPSEGGPSAPGKKG